MATAIGAMSVDLQANSAAFAADMGRAQRALTSSTARMNRSLARLDKGFGSIDRTAGRIARRLLVIGGPAGMLLLTKRSLEAADAIAKTADKVGLSTDALQEYRFAADLAGVKTATFDMAMQRFSRRVGEAVQGKGELVGTLKQYGIAVTDAQGRTRSIEAVLNDYADAIAGAGSEQEQLRLSFKGFDSEGAALVNMFRNGSAAVARMREEARSLGVVIDADLIRNAERANDQLTRLSTVLEMKVTATMVKLAPVIDRTVTGLLKFIELLAIAHERMSFDPKDYSIATLQYDLDITNEKLKELQATLERFERAGDIWGANKIRAEVRDMQAAAGALQARIDLMRKMNEGGGGAGAVPAGAAAGADAGKVIGDLQTQLDRQIVSLENRNLLFGESEGRLARVNAEQRIHNALMDANIQRSQENLAPFKTYLDHLEAATNRSVALREAERQRLEEQRALEERLEEQRQAAEQKLAEQRQRSERAAATAAQTITGGMERMILSAENAADAMRNLAAAIGQVILRAAVLGPIESTVGSFFSGLTSGLFGGGGVSPTPGDIAGTPFASGGQFTVGGRGGTDANYVPLRLSRGERVTVETEAQQRAGGAGGGIVIGSIDMRGASLEAVARLEGLLARLNASIESRVAAKMYDTRRRGGRIAA